MLVADSLIGGCDICINAQTEMFSIAFRISYHFCFLLLTPTQLLHQTFLILPIRTITVSLLCMPISTLFQFWRCFISQKVSFMILTIATVALFGISIALAFQIYTMLKKIAMLSGKDKTSHPLIYWLQIHPTVVIMWVTFACVSSFYPWIITDIFLSADWTPNEVCDFGTVWETTVAASPSQLGSQKRLFPRGYQKYTSILFGP